VIYPSLFEKKLGFDRIRETLRENCLGPLGQAKADSMQFSFDAGLVEASLRCVSEMKEIMQSPAVLPSHHFYDVTPVLAKLRIEGTYPEIQDGFDLMRSLDTIHQLIRFFSGNEEKKYPCLRQLASTVLFDNTVSDLLHHIYTKDGDISDNASPKLSDIRRELTSKQREVSKRISRLMKEAQASEWVDNELSLSVRDGRLVIPVLALHKRKIRGIVHDESATGKTVYIEPEEIVELNNDIREIEYAERREIIVILTGFANEIRLLIDAMLTWYDFLGQIDFVRAKALYAVKVNAHLPSLVNKPVVEWFDAVHPLLYLHLKSEGKKIVPLKISLNQKGRILVISGPNAGGKSVCLQTVGLLQYMMQCGMLVPCKPTSEMGIFKNIFIDIGDEQSIENDLSTYSSRLMNMKHFLKHADSRTLILIDEFGTGTEPLIGGAIAESILRSLNAKECFGVITTHYTNIKHYAMSAEGISNGAMLYDTALLQPLFELQIGEPGSSFAFEIARKIGLPEDILKDAEKNVGEEHITFDKNLREILRDKHYWERKRESIKDNEKRLDEVVERYGKELSEISALRKQILDEAKREAKDLLSGTNRQIEQTIREIKEAQAEKGKTIIARRNLEETKKNIEKTNTEKDDRIVRKMEQIRQRQERKQLYEDREEKKTDVVKPKKLTPIKAGDKVRFKSRQDVVAEVLSAHGNSMTLAVGHMHMTAKRDEIEKISANEFKNPVQTKPSTMYNTELSKKRLNFQQRIDVRGMRGDEAMKEITTFIDEAIMIGVNEVSILHGKGNGILRELIRSYLKGIKEIESYADAPVDRGGAGITEVKFK
jgi:DNA mismatch repair protein MutS2